MCSPPTHSRMLSGIHTSRGAYLRLDDLHRLEGFAGYGSGTMTELAAVRFAVGPIGLGYHRVRRSAEARGIRGSVLDTLEGVGDARRRALINFFGSPDKVISASLEELEGVPGLPGKVARRIYEQLNRLGGTSVVGADPKA